MKTFARNEVGPSWWANALDAFLYSGASNFLIQWLTATSVRVLAGTGDGRAAISIGGLWRYRTTTVNRTHPGGAAGRYSLWVTAANNVIVNTPLPNTDNTNYGFDLAITTEASSPAIVAGTVDVFRRVALIEWDGAQITRVTPLIPDLAGGPVYDGSGIGRVYGWCGSTDPSPDSDGTQRELLADGRLIDRTVHGIFYTKFGHAFNGGVDPGASSVRIPDLRGRTLVGPDNMGTAQGAASRLTISNRALGQTGGLERQPAPPGHQNEAGVIPGQTNHDPIETGDLLNVMQPYQILNLVVRVR